MGFEALAQAYRRRESVGLISFCQLAFCMLDAVGFVLRVDVGCGSGEGTYWMRGTSE